MNTTALTNFPWLYFKLDNILDLGDWAAQLLSVCTLIAFASIMQYNVYPPPYDPGPTPAKVVYNSGPCRENPNQKPSEISDKPFLELLLWLGKPGPGTRSDVSLHRKSRPFYLSGEFKISTFSLFAASFPVFLDTLHQLFKFSVVGGKHKNVHKLELP